VATSTESPPFTPEPEPIAPELPPEFRQPFIRKYPILSSVLAAIVVLAAFTLFAYLQFARTIAARLEKEPQGNIAVYYAAPRTLAPGEESSPATLIAELKTADYRDAPAPNTRYYLLRGETVEIHPGPSYAADPARITFHKHRIARIASLKDNSGLQTYPLEPRPFANLQGQNRERHGDLSYAAIPANLTHAILSAEDKHFFQHPGFDPARIAKAIYINWKSGKKEQGGSTLTMQLARNLWLDREKTWKRKSLESLITIVLEQKLTKQRIFQMYCNKIYLGRHANYSIYGFGPAAHAYFDKDVGDLTLAEAALLAGMAQRPTYFDPLRNPDHALERRNLVLGLMRQNGYLSESDWRLASQEPLSLKPRILDTDGAPFFLTLANDEAQAALREDSSEFAGARIYTTLDQNLQNAAREAVEQGMKAVYSEIKAQRKRRPDGVLPQVALIALDPHTGEVKAVIGGRNYAESQLNHALSKRQPGSVFKPFVYAAALQGSLSGFQEPMTPSTTVDDVPTTFRFGNQRYTPGNFGQRFYGSVTLRQALAHSMNVATIKVAEKIGYNRVVNLANSAGLNDAIRATPAVALGAYEATPLEIAGAYTIFANRGVYVKPTFLSSVQLPDKTQSAMPDRQTHQVLDPRVSFLMTDMLEEVVRTGTAARVRSLGLAVPVAGKTGTSRDGWFAGFSSGLLCIVWVGYDDNSELGLEGAKSALPIWVEFMKRAVRYPGYASAFSAPPAGVSTVTVDPSTGQLAGPNCPATRQEYFIEGTEPTAPCDLHPDDPPPALSSPPQP
jgi:penicillin-binding protein 1B